MEERRKDTYKICNICKEMTISRIKCQNCGARLDLKNTSNNSFKTKFNPTFDNIANLKIKEHLKKFKEIRDKIKKNLEKEKKEKEERERREKERIRREREKILQKVNNKYNDIKNDLPIPFSIDKNTIEKLIHSNSEKCLICLENYIENNQVLYLPCSHLFHSFCILRWLLENSKCPICQTDFRRKFTEREVNVQEEREGHNINIVHNGIILNNPFVNQNQMNFHIYNNIIFINNNNHINDNFNINREIENTNEYLNLSGIGYYRGRENARGRGRGGGYIRQIYNRGRVYGRGRGGSFINRNYRGRGNIRGRGGYFGRGYYNFGGAERVNNHY